MALSSIGSKTSKNALLDQAKKLKDTQRKEHAKKLDLEI